MTLTLVVAADEFVPGVAGEVAGVAEAEPVARPLDHPDLVLHATGQRHLQTCNRCLTMFLMECSDEDNQNVSNFKTKSYLVSITAAQSPPHRVISGMGSVNCVDNALNIY